MTDTGHDLFSGSRPLDVCFRFRCISSAELMPICAVHQHYPDRAMIMLARADLEQGSEPDFPRSQPLLIVGAGQTGPFSQTRTLRGDARHRERLLVVFAHEQQPDSTEEEFWHYDYYEDPGEDDGCYDAGRDNGVS